MNGTEIRLNILKACFLAMALASGVAAQQAPQPQQAQTQQAQPQQAQQSQPPQQDPGWPRELTNGGAKLVYYQPQVDEWKDFKLLETRMAASLTPPGEKEKLGVIYVRMQTQVDVDNHLVTLSNPEITKTSFPGLEPKDATRMDQLARSFLTPNRSITISLDRLVASVNKTKAPPRTAPALKNDPPEILVSYKPAILLLLNGDPVRAPVEKTGLEFVVNANWPLFFEKASSTYFLYTGQQWIKALDIRGPWSTTKSLPPEMAKVAQDPNWGDLKDAVPPKHSNTPPPDVFMAKGQAELILFHGQPSLQGIPSTQLAYATNTESDVFVHTPTRKYYYMTRGRWFSAADLKGPWSYATTSLPPDFANIPRNSPAARVLASVPGTPEAEDAVLLAQVPTTAVINPAEAEAKVNVAYSGDPQFKPIENTNLSYATNTPDKVIKVGDMYYLCFEGVWFMSNSPNGPWKTAKSVPKEIYEIPASSPVYNVTYVTQTTNSDGDVEASCTAGYFGGFIVGATMGAFMTWGTGYYYPPYMGYWGGSPVYYPYARTYGAGAYYNGYRGAYGGARGVYGPYGGATWGASYNPRTGTYARGATVSGPNGSRSAGRAYNPYTGAYGATRQGSNVYSNWGTSAVTRNGQSAVTRHYSNANGSVGSVRTSSGGKAVAGVGANGGGFAGKTRNGDVYAGRDGNVYRNNNGNWQQYQNGSWNSTNRQSNRQSVDSSRASSFSGQRTSTAPQGLQKDYQGRQRGASESRSFSNSQRSSGFSGGGGARRGGGGRGGGRRR